MNIITVSLKFVSLFEIDQENCLLLKVECGCLILSSIFFRGWERRGGGGLSNFKSTFRGAMPFFSFLGGVITICYVY